MERNDALGFRGRALRVPLLLLAAVLGASGQQAERAAPAPLRVLAVGEAPPFRQELRDGVRHELEAPAGSLPPRAVTVPAAGDRDGEVGELRLALGTVSEPVPAAAGRLVLSKRVDGEAAARWLEFAMPGRAALLVVFRDPRGSSWDSVIGIPMADDAAAFAAGKVRFVNATPYTAGISFQGGSLVLEPGRVAVRGASAGGVLDDEPLVVAVRGADDRAVRVFDGTLSQGAGERTNVVIHWSDGVSPRRPAKVLVHRERPVVRQDPAGG